MISDYLKRRIFFYLSVSFRFILSLLLISLLIIQTHSFLNLSDFYSPGLILLKDLERMKFGVAEAAEITHRILWHSAGPPDHKLNRPQGFCLDPDTSRIYVADTDNNRVIIFTMDGEIVGPFLTSHPVKRPFDLIVGPDSQIYISQIDKRTIEVFNKKGVWQASIPNETNGKGLELTPGRLAFDSKGRLLVNDRGTGILWFLTKEGKVIKKQYVEQMGEGIRLLTGLAIDNSGKIYVISAQGSPVISVMDTEGVKIHSFGRHGAINDDSLSFPSSLAIGNKGRIWVVDAFRHTIKVFGPDGGYLFSIGTFGEQPGRFVYPVDIDIDKEGKLYVLDKGAGRLQAFSVIFEGTE